jgi:acetylornithine/succinyldiaminopimelate/putrescine aminotransferase
VTDPDFAAQVRQTGASLSQALQALQDPRIVELRGTGLMLGLEFNCDIKKLIQICMDKGLLLIGAGPRVVRFVPPLTINEKEIKQALAIFKEAIKEWK